MNEELSFDPFFLFKSSLYQTIVGSLITAFEPRSKRKIIHLQDSDKLSLEITTPKRWKERDLTVVMVHGLCGSHRSPTLIRMARKLSSKGIRVVRVNLRGCGSGRGMAKKTYHCGDYKDIFEVVKVLKYENMDSPITLVGFSLGGNLVLKLAGEMKRDARQYLKEVIALSPPVDIESSVELFEKPENRLYLKHFTKLLRDDIEFLKRTFNDFPNIDLPEDMTMRDFNILFIVPFFGFKDLDDYYKKASSKSVISKIEVPCKILLSEDDPLISATSLDDLELPGNIKVFKTRKGGHLGYLGSPRNIRGFYWLDSLLLDWIEGSL